MPREFPRSRRVGEQIHRILSELLRSEVKDPRLIDVSLTQVQASKDLSHAKVFYTLLDPKEDHMPAQEALERAAGFLRGQLGRAIKIRQVPELHFRYDDTSEKAARLDALISEAIDSDLAKEQTSEGRED